MSVLTITVVAVTPHRQREALRILHAMDPTELHAERITITAEKHSPRYLVELTVDGDTTSRYAAVGALMAGVVFDEPRDLNPDDPFDDLGGKYLGGTR